MSIYKFVSDNRIDVLKNLLIRFTQPIQWNDPFEMKPSFYEEEIDGIHIEIDETGKINKSVDVELLINEELVSLSLSDNLHNLLMWSHYANNHKGYVIEFDEKNSFFSKTNNYFFKIPYSNIRPRLTLKETKMIVNSIIETFDTKTKRDDKRFHKLELLFTKSIYWNEEKEWRLITLSKDATKIINSDTNKATINFNLNRETKDIISSNYLALFSIPPNSIKSIYLGCKIKPLLRREIFDILEENKELKHVQVFQSQVSKSDYKLDFFKIEKKDTRTIKELYG
jgi:hypothetical protein